MDTVDAPGRPAACLVAPAELTDFVARVVTGLGASAEHARCVAESLVESNLAGHDSHGVMKLPSYVRDARAGKLRVAATPVVVKQTPTTALIDGMGGFGHVGAQAAVDVATAKARECGLALVAVSHCHHTGRLGRWSERIAAAGMIGIAMGAEARPPYLVAPYGGRHGALSTNPVTVAVPRRASPPILVDYATSAVSIGKLQMARVTGESIPDGWVIDAEGRPTTDLDAYFGRGYLLPFGAYKGFGLGVVAELLAVGLSGGDQAPPGERSSCLSILALDIAAVRDRDDFDQFVDTVAARIHAVPPREPGRAVLLPGEPETRARRERAAGIPIPPATFAALREVADDLGVEPPPRLPT